MTEYLRRRMNSASAMSPWLWWSGLFAILALGPATVVLSADSSYFSTLASEDSPLFNDALAGRSGQALGAVVRGGYFTGPAVGRVKGIAPVEVMPYMFLDTGMILGDVRGFRADNGYWGTNLGLGYRHYIEGWDRIIGTNFFYDYDNTSTRIFRQMGFGLETYGEHWDMRANAYFPIGTQTQLLQTDLVPNSLRYSGHELLYDLQNTFGTALKGADAEIGIPIPFLGEFTQSHDLRVYAGGYHYESDSTGGFNGWSGRVQGNLLPNLLLQLLVTEDSHFDTNVVFGATWSYGGFKQSPEERQNQFSRMTTPIWRNYNIVIDRNQVLVPDQVAKNPNTGDPYFFDHVASYASSGGNGTVESPFQTIAQANADPNLPTNGDGIVFVHADSVYSTAPSNVINLESGVRYLGEGNNVVHGINILGVGNNIPLPRATTGTDRPLFTNITGNGVNLVSNTEFSGFQLGDPNVTSSGPTGNGIFGFNVSNVILNYDDINYAGGDGMFFNNVGSGIISAHSAILNPQGVGLHVDGGTPTIVFSGDSISGNAADITTTGNAAVVVENVLAGGSVNLNGASISNTDSSSNGILINNVAGSVTLGPATITSASDASIEIQDSTGTFTFRGGADIITPGGIGIDIQNLGAGGTVNFLNGQSVNIGSRNDVGINIVSNMGTVQFNGDTIIGNPDPNAPDTATGINWQGNSGSTVFNTVTIVQSNGGEGFVLKNNSGSFQVQGATTVNGNATFNDSSNNPVTLVGGIGIDISGNTTVNSAASSIQFVSGADVIRGDDEGISIKNNGDLVRFNGTSNISNPTAGTDSAVDIQQNTGNVQFATLSITDAIGDTTLPDYGAGLNILNNPAGVTVSTALNITSTDGVALFADSVGSLTAVTGGLTIVDGAITEIGTTATTGRAAVEIHDSVYNVSLTSVNASNSQTYGIDLQHNLGTTTTTTTTNGVTTVTSTGFDFEVTGTNAGLGSGGTITGSNLAGVRAQDSGNVSLANMIITNNLGNGVRAESTHTGSPIINQREIQLLNDQISGNNLNGLLAIDTQIVDVETSTFSNNGGTDVANNEIQIVVQTPDSTTTTSDNYSFLLANNLITHNLASAAVLVNTTTSGTGANGTFQETSNTITTTAYANSTTGTVATGTTLNWNGNINALFDLNLYNLIGGLNTGILFNAPSSNSANLATLQILSNSFQGSVGGNTAMNVTTGGPANILVGNLLGNTNGFVGNLVNFNGQPQSATGFAGFTDTAMVFALGPNANLNIADNQSITINVDGGTGILFTTVQAPSSIAISDNGIAINQPTDLGFTERGIIFQAVLGGTAAVGSAVDNTIILDNGSSAGTQLFFAPTGSLNGSISINGQFFP